MKDKETLSDVLDNNNEVSDEISTIDKAITDIGEVVSKIDITTKIIFGVAVVSLIVSIVGLFV